MECMLSQRLNEGTFNCGSKNFFGEAENFVGLKGGGDVCVTHLNGYSSTFLCLRFYIFTKPVDEDEVPDYRSIIKEPMDLETMMTKIDHHQYECAQDFLRDIDLICTNALEYNPDRNPEGKADGDVLLISHLYLSLLSCSLSSLLSLRFVNKIPIDHNTSVLSFPPPQFMLSLKVQVAGGIRTHTVC